MEFKTLGVGVQLLKCTKRPLTQLSCAQCFGHLVRGWATSLAPTHFCQPEEAVHQSPFLCDYIDASAIRLLSPCLVTALVSQQRHDTRWLHISKARLVGHPQQFGAFYVGWPFRDSTVLVLSLRIGMSTNRLPTSCPQSLFGGPFLGKFVRHFASGSKRKTLRATLSPLANSLFEP